MTDKDKPRYTQPVEDELLFGAYSAQGDEQDDGGQGGKTGKIDIRIADTLSTPKRDDLLSPAELKRLVKVHQALHKQRVDKQRQTREERAAVKEGRYVAPPKGQYNQGLGRGKGAASKHRSHPILSAKPQFDGIDKQVVGVPDKNVADTNAELREELENRLENRLNNVPKFHPKPRFPG